MAHLRNHKAPAAYGEHVWDDADHVVEVDGETANVLLHIQDGGFHEVLPGDDAHPDKSVLDYGAFKVDELRTECEARGLDPAGKKDDLIDRLVAADAAAETPITE